MKYDFISKIYYLEIGCKNFTRDRVDLVVNLALETTNSASVHPYRYDGLQHKAIFTDFLCNIKFYSLWIMI